MKSRKDRKAKQATGFNEISKRLNPIACEIHALKQKALTALHAVGYTLLLSHVTFVPYAYASPTGGTVVGGTGTITQSGVTTDIYQQSSSMAIDWNSYNLNSDEVVNYIQPDSSSLSLNRILSNDPSQINGQINANGHVILVNPNGLFFGGTSSVNVGGLIASGLDISPNDFMNGNYIFNEVLGTNGTVINSGLINAATGGNVTLLGKQVQNQGVISANLGAVNMAAGKQAVLTFDNQGLIGVSVTNEVLQSELGVDPAVLNSGEINANGGRILLTASQSQDVFSRAVNTGDITQATSVVANADGTFDLTGGADVVNNGTLNASASDANANGGDIVVLGQNVTSSGTITADAQQGNGGNIELHAVDTTLLTGNSTTTARAETIGQGGIVKILGDKVGLFDQSRIDVSGANGGGQALIGGDYQGQNTLIRNASRTYISTNAQIIADALIDGDGGKIINWGNDYTWFYGSASAKGGAYAGSGGFVEISGKNGISFDGAVDTTAANGEMGTLLFDPTDIIIHDRNEVGYETAQPLDPNIGDLATSGTFDISELDLENISTSSNILLQATNNVTINDLVDDTLDLSANAGGSLEITAGGTFEMLGINTDTIKTSGDNVTITAGNIIAGSIDTQGAVNSGDNGGDVALTTTTGDLVVSGSINTSGADDGGGSGGIAGSIRLDNGNISATASMDVLGDLTADGGNGIDVGNASTIDLVAANGSVTLHGDISAVGASNGNITLDAPNIVIDDGNDSADQTIEGGTINIGTATDSTQLALLQNLNVTAGNGANATIFGDVSYAGIASGSGELNVYAGDTVTLDGSITNSTSDQLAVTLTANNADGDATGDVVVNGNVHTGGGAFQAEGVNYSGTAGTITTTGAADQGGGIVSITSTESSGNTGINVGAITTTGGSVNAGNNGTAGGTITLTATNGADIHANAAIDSSGQNADANGSTGGSAGDIGIYTTGAITADSTLTANNGAGASGAAGSGGNITLAGDNTLDGNNLPTTASGAVDTGAITAHGGDVSVKASSITVASIDTTGVTRVIAGSGTDGGNINLSATTGDITVSGTLDSNGSGAVADGDTPTAYDGGDAGTIDLTSTGGSVILGGDVEAVGGDGVDGGAEGAGATITLSNLQLDSSRLITAGVGADVSIGAIDYDTIGASGTLEINAGDDVILGAGIADSGTPDLDQLDVTLTANTDGDAAGNVDITGNINTGGGSFEAFGANYTNTALNTITTEGGLVQIDTTSAITMGSINTKGVTEVDGGDVKLTSGAALGTGINVGAITTDGGDGAITIGTGPSSFDAAMSAGNVTLTAGDSDIQVNGNISSIGGDVTTTAWGHGGAGGNVIFNSTGGDVYVAGAVDTSGTTAKTGGNYSYPGGDAGDIRIGASGTITAVGDLTANGGASSVSAGVVGAGGTIAIGGADTDNTPPVPSAATSSSAVILQGDVISNGGTNGDITVNTQALTIDGAAAQSISGNAINLASSTNALKLTQNLTVTAGAGANARIDGNIDYDGMGSAGTLTVQAGDNVTLNGTISDGNNLVADQLSVTLAGNNGDGDLVGNVDVNGSITTGGGAFDVTGVNYDARSSAANKYTITAGDSTIDMTGNVALGEMDISGTLDVTSGGAVGISQGDINADGDDLAVTGISTFTSNTADALIALGSTGNNLQGEISLTSTGTSYSDITLYNSAANTTLGTVDAYGDLTVVAEGNLTVNGAITGYDTDGLSPGTSLTLDFAQQNRVNEHTFDLTATGSINRDSGTIDLTINGGVGADTFNLLNVGGSIDQNFNSTTIDGLAGNDTFNLGVDIAGTVEGGDGNDVFNIADATISISALRGGGNDAANAPYGDTLVGDNANNQWNITGAGSGNINGTGGIVFYEIENLTGGNGDDTFSFEESGSVNGTIQAGLGRDTVDYSGQTTVVVNLTDAYNGVVDAEVIKGNGSNSTLIGDNVANDWGITGENSGSVGSIEFEGFNYLTGGSDTDTFTFYAANTFPGHPDDGSIMGMIDGAGGSDTANYSALGDTTVYLSDMQNIESVIGDGNATVTLVAENGVNTWQLYAPTNMTSDNTVTDNTSTGIDTTTVVFTGFSNLTGGSENDTFIINEAGAGTELIDGGNGIDTMDYSRLAVVSVDLDLNTATFSNIERLVGNGSNSTLIGDNAGDTWSITGNNSGDITGTTTIAFTDFNILRGGTGNDIFNVQSGGSVGDQVLPDADTTSGIFGGDGDDTLNVVFGGAAGSLRFDGGNDNDAVNLAGGNATYSGGYLSNAVGSYDRISYASGGNTYSVNYLGSETINDDVIAADFTVNGTLGDDAIVLYGNAYQLNARQQVTFSGKNSLLVDALAGTDSIDLAGDLGIVDTLTLTAESITNTSGTVTASSLTLAGVGTVGTDIARLSTDIDNLSIANASGDIYIVDASGVSIGTLNNLSGDLFLTANSGNITDGAALTSATGLHLETVNGSIELNNANRLSGALNLSASSNITLRNVTDTNLSNVTAGGLTVDTDGTLAQTGTLDVSSLNVIDAQSVNLDNGSTVLTISGLNSRSDVYVHAGGLSDIANVVVSGDATFESDNGVRISSITSTNGTVSVAASNGQILANTTGTNITAGDIVLSATSGIGLSDHALTTNTGGTASDPGHMNVQNGSGLIQMSNTGNVLVEMMSTTSGNISLTNTDTVIIDRIETSTDVPGNKVTVVTDNGSILGAGNIPARTKADADIAAYSVDIVANGGSIGAANRPLVIWAEGTIETYGTVSYGTIFLPPYADPDRIHDTSLVNFSASDTLAALSGEQVTEVEALDDVDPAIFTEVHNYNYAEISIMLPKDQLYDNEQ